MTQRQHMCGVTVRAEAHPPALGTQRQRPWVIVLAGGEGTRLAPLTTALYGNALPKQFAVLVGGRSLLQQTVARACRLTSPERVSVVVAAHHEARARDQLRRWPGVEVIVQPRNLDTGPGMLLPLARIRARDPRARVVVLPADHYFTDERPLLDALRASNRGPGRRRITLIGVEPDRPETDYGWIVRGARLEGQGSEAFAVDQFREKPGEATARALRASGALWNTFISAGPIAGYWRLARAFLPEHARLFEQYGRRVRTRGEAEALASAYRKMEAANFSRDVFAHAANLAVIPLAGSGWSDWGSPRRVFESLAGTPDHARLLERIAAPRPRLLRATERVGARARESGSGA